jgi:hypothetical protein
MTTPRAQRAKPPAVVDVNQRYSLQESAATLRISMSQLYVEMREGRIRSYRDGGRTYIHGSELVRRAAPPAAVEQLAQ